MRERNSATASQLPAQRLNQHDFHKLFIESQGRVYGFIRTLLPSQVEDAHEVFQDCCVIILEKRQQFQAGTDFTKWACQIAYYEVLNYRRRKQKCSPAFSEELLELLAGEQCSSGEQPDRRRMALSQCLKKLQADHKSLVEAKYWKGMRLSELADLHDRPLGTIKKILARIRRGLQKCIERNLAREERGR